MAEVLVKQVQKRVLRLEDLMAQLLVTTDRTERNLDRLSAEMRDFKDEMRDFKDEMREDRERSEQQMQEFRHHLEENERKMRKETERFLRKMGTLAEDMVAPSIPTILRQTFGCSKKDIEFLAVRVKKLHPVTRKQREYDVVAVCGEYLCINETKSRVTPKDFKKFAEKALPKAREFFPEYAAKKIIGIIASFYVDESLVRYGERLGLIVLGFGEEMMAVLNQPGFVPKSF